MGPNQRRLDEAVALHREGKLTEAAIKYEALLAINPNDAALLNLTGILAGQMGDYTRSLMLLQRAVQAKPAEAHFRNSLAVTLERIGNVVDAAAAFNEEGNLLLPHYLHREALTAFGHAMRLQPNSPQYKCNYAVALIKLGRPEEAVDLLTTTPDEDRLSYIPLNLGNALAGLPKPSEAIAAYDRALKMEPTMVEAHWAKGQMQLLTGNYAQGLEEYEWRKNWAHFANPYRSLPEWRGEPAAALNGKLLVVTEQGFGDTIQFSRYVKILAAQGYKVILELPEPLVALFAEGFAGDDIETVPRAAMPARLGECTAHVMLMSLPHRFATRVDTIPGETPYLTASAARIAAQKERMPKCEHRHIGIVRAGQSLHGNDYIRSIPAAVLEPLLDAGADFHSLQIVKFDHPKVIELGLGFRDFADTAAAIMAMDLVITVDTSVAHLAGALGKQVWILIPHAPDWRWGLSGTKTPWYPNARLFRQEDASDWPRVIGEVRAALDTFLSPGVIDTSPILANPDDLDPTTPAYFRALAAKAAASGETLKAAATYAELADFEQGEQLYEEAVADYAAAIALDQSNPHLFNNYGVALRCLGKGDEAIAAFSKAIAIDPVLYSALSNRANTYWDNGNTAEAFADHRAAIEARPDDAQTHLNYAVALRETSAVEEALAEYDRTIELAPDFAQAHYDRGQLLAQMGDLKAGFAEMEWRWAPSYNYKERPRGYRQSVWKGELPEKLRGRLLIISEQGFGDMIQFSRYAKALVDVGYKIVLEVPQPLLRLYTEGFARPGLRVVARPTPAAKQPRGLAKLFGGGMPSFAAYVGALSLPERFMTTLKAIPTETPYLSVKPSQVEKLATRMKAPKDKLRVGLVWQGDPKHPQDKTRSLPPALLHKLLENDAVQFYTLQKGPMEAWKFPYKNVTRLGPVLEDFYDTAAAIENLDLVITVDTSVAHLAGALGKPVWIMLTRVGEWRWLMEGETTPWYPTARLFRQTTQGVWQDVVTRMAEELRVLAST